MNDYLLLILVFLGLRFAENIVNKWVEKSKLTANTWDDALSKALQSTIKYINTIIKFKK